MNLSPLDNPVWHALNSYHEHLAIRGDGAVRYPPDILGAAALPEKAAAAFGRLGWPGSRRRPSAGDAAAPALTPASAERTCTRFVHACQC